MTFCSDRRATTGWSEGAGSDLIVSGLGDDLIIWNDGDGNDSISDDVGMDTLRFTGAAANEAIQLSFRRRLAIHADPKSRRSPAGREQR